MSNQNVSIEKYYPVGVSELYKAWTDEEALKAWWKPAGRVLESVEADLKEGGVIKYTFEPANSEEKLVIEGQYETVIPNEQLVYTWNWEMENEPVENGLYRLTINFAEDGEGAKLIVNQESNSSQDGIHPHEEGWEKALQDLAEYLSA